ncbi:uncharacterized protein LOC143028613 [Oratosquilla oratoria]|uniref:uncharacterized protein LOC143028613 n=1 Tax=Oratosquilla oratoria TaxID=337810 RepID=UPI003F762DC2
MSHNTDLVSRRSGPATRKKGSSIGPTTFFGQPGWEVRHLPGSELLGRVDSSEPLRKMRTTDLFVCNVETTESFYHTGTTESMLDVESSNSVYRLDPAETCYGRKTPEANCNVDVTLLPHYPIEAVEPVRHGERGSPMPNHIETPEPLCKLETREQMNKLLFALGLHLPLAASVHNVVMMASKGVDTHEVFQPKSEKHRNRVVVYKEKNQNRFGFHCKPEDADYMKGILLNSKILSLSDAESISHVPEFLIDVVTDVLRERGVKGVEVEALYPMYYYDRERTMVWRESEVNSGDGYVRRLSEAGIRKCFDSCPRRRSCDSFQTYRSIAAATPTAGLFKEASQDGEEVEGPVCWVTTDCGALGMLMAKEGSWQAVHSPRVFMTCAKMMAAEGYMPHCYATQSQLESLLLSLGWSLSHRISWIRCK